jgi:hypothetical protein
MVGSIKSAHKEANEMLSNKVRTTIIGLVASVSFVGASVAPAVSQAQWHTYCTAGHCITHSNFTIGGAEPCSVVSSNYSKAREALSDAKTTAEKEEAEGRVHSAEIESFTWGCDVVPRSVAAPVVAAPVATAPSMSMSALP